MVCQDGISNLKTHIYRKNWRFYIWQIALSPPAARLPLRHIDTYMYNEIFPPDILSSVHAWYCNNCNVATQFEQEKVISPKETQTMGSLENRKQLAALAIAFVTPFASLRRHWISRILLYGSNSGSSRPIQHAHLTKNHIVRKTYVAIAKLQASAWLLGNNECVSNWAWREIPPESDILLFHPVREWGANNPMSENCGI